MNNVFGLVSATAAALFLVVFLTSIPGERLLGLRSASTAGVDAADHNCRLQNPLFAYGRGGGDLLYRLRQV